VDVGEMQKKLSQWAEQDKELRFFDLYHLLHQEDWIGTAQGHVKRNVGSRTAGCDGVTMRGFEEELEENLRNLQKTIKEGRFEPQPVRRTYIQEIKALPEFP
jgi:RNA-directed DNA polymerase